MPNRVYETLTPEERSMRARAAAFAMHSQGKTNTQAAFKARWEKFYDEVDPDRTLPEDERNRRADQARKAFMAKMALKASKARREKATAKGADR